MKLLGNRILVRLDDSAASSLILAPEQTRKLADFGEVLQLGTGTKIPAELKPGQRVRVDNSYNSVGYPLPNGRDRIYSVADIQAILG